MDFYECKNADTIRRYVGVYASGFRTVFDYDHEPNESDRLPYLYVIGPFETANGAEYMARYGRNNPHCQHVANAERLAKKYGI